METLISSRLFGHFAETFREGKTITENKVTDAYGEFISQLSLLANGEQAVMDKLRHLRILELELALYRDIPGHRPEHIMEIYLTKTTSLVKMEIELLLFSVEHPECQVSSDMQKKRSGVPSIHWNGSTTSLMELIASLDYSVLSPMTTVPANPLPAWLPHLRNSSTSPFPSHTTFVPTLPAERRTSPSCFQNSRRIMRKT